MSENYQLFPSNERGFADYGWLNTHYSFSFANWYHPKKIHFGMLRVLNDDLIAPHSGFDLHPHSDMEIITIPFSGELTHYDNTGNKSIIKSNEIQVMSAGTGIWHAEKNESNEWVSLFQIWIFPDKKGHLPRYDKTHIALIPDQFNLLISPKDKGNPLWIHQNAYISRGIFESSQEISYQLYDKRNAIYLMVINGAIQWKNITLNKKDAIGIENTHSLSLQIQKKNSDILIIEVPKN